MAATLDPAVDNNIILSIFGLLVHYPARLSNTARIAVLASGVVNGAVGLIKLAKKPSLFLFFSPHLTSSPESLNIFIVFPDDPESMTKVFKA